MAYNVHGFRAGTAEVAAAVESERPDILLLNETRYLGLRLRRFARRVGMRRASGTGVWRPIPNAILVRPPWRIVRKEVLIFPRTRRTVRRGLVVAVGGRAGTRLSIAALHLGLHEGERKEHARVVTDFLAGRREAVVLGGDLNEGPEGPATSWIAGRYWDVFSRAGEGDGSTFPTGDPRARIDYLFVSQGVEVERAWVGGRSFSGTADHLPVVADLSAAADVILGG